MRILHVNKFLYRRGGAEAYMLDVADLQSAQGHEVAFFGMRSDENPELRYRESFPSEVRFEPPPRTATGKARAIGRMLYSTSARRGIDAVIDDFRPDVVHLHNVYHQLSPSVIAPARARRIPAVMTLHDYKLACPTYRFLDHGRACEACLDGRFRHAIAKRCNGGSLGASAVSAFESALHRRMRSYAGVDRFVCPSRFLEAKMRAAGVYPDRLRAVPNFVDAARYSPKRGPCDGVVFAGRLSHEKGVDTLLRAIALVPDARLDVLGDGPERARLETLAADLSVGDRAVFHGRTDAAEVRKRLECAAVAVVPSRWYENQPLAVLEAFAAGTPVVGTELGGVPELIRRGVDGEVVEPDHPLALADALRRLLESPDRSFAMGRAAREQAERVFAPAVHLERLYAVYAEAGARVA